MKNGTRVFIKALIDSGNLFGDILSERLANLLKIKYKPCANKAGTAVANQKVHVLGLADPFDLILEGLEDPIKVQPYVICSLSHDLNLGDPVALLTLERKDLSYMGPSLVPALQPGERCV